MGNCVETFRHSQEVEKEPELEGKPGGFVKESCIGKGGMRIKVVLTKEELELLLFQLKNKEGMRLEDVLGEIERGRDRSVSVWKPSLESIMESPELLEMDK